MNAWPSQYTRLDQSESACPRRPATKAAFAQKTPMAASSVTTLTGRRDCTASLGASGITGLSAVSAAAGITGLSTVSAVSGVSAVSAISDVSDVSEVSDVS